MGKRTKNPDITEEQMLGYIKRWGAYNINPWRAARQHKDLLDGMTKRGLLECHWGRRHCLRYTLTRAGEFRTKENPA